MLGHDPAEECVVARKKMSRETRAKISATLKARWATETPPSPPEEETLPNPEVRDRPLARPLLHGYPVPREGRRF